MSNVLNYKKPAFWIIIVAVISVAVVAVCFLTNSLDSSNTPLLKVLNNEAKATDEEYRIDGQEVSKKEWEEKTEKYLKYDVIDDGRKWYDEDGNLKEK